MQPQTGDPSTNSTQIGLYSKLVSSIPELFFAPSSSQTPIQLTYPSISTSSTLAQQYSFCAGPFVVYAGIITNPSNGQLVPLTPTTNLLYVGTITANYKLGSLIQSTVTVPTNVNTVPGSFNVNYDIVGGTTTRDVYYIAIGQ